MRRDKIASAVETWLTTKTARPVGLRIIPAGATPPYAIVYPLYSPRPDEESMDGGEKDRDFVFQVTSVGVTDEQCGWMSSKVADAWCTGDGPTIPDAAVEMRLSDRLGAILPSGESLFVADDTYRIRVGSKY